ncbi:MAG: protein kinase domain-containing protein [Isosphaeraceae bacterium]
MTSGDPGETGATNRLGNEATTGQSETGDPDPAHAVHESQTVFGDVEPRSAEASRTGSSATDSMADLDEFKRVLIELGIIGSDELGAFEMDPSSGVLGLARVLVRAGRLTSYQSAAIYQKKSRGLLIGRYLILDKLGQGGMGVVFKAQKRKTGKIVALKILPPSFARDQQAVARFKREIEAAGRLNHPNIVAALDADEDRGVHLLVMDYVDGRDLDRIVQTRGPLPVVEAVDCLIQAARGLEAAHAQGIVHRDIKPGNLMLDAGGNVRVLDLGLARIVEAANPFGQAAGSRLTQSGMYMGTIDYMAPEQAEDSRRADHRADIYSLGCTLHYLLTGREPFEAETILKRLLAHQERPAPKLRAARPDAPPALEAVFQKMMAKRPADRPATMTELIALLESCKALAAEGRAAAGEAPKSRPELKVFDEPLKRAAPAKTKAEPSIFTVLDKTEGPPRIKEDLRLEDLVMDVRPETPPAPLPASPRTRRTVIENPRRAALAPSGRRRSVRSRPPWLWPAVAAGALVCGLLISWINGVFKVRTKDGLIVLENVPENAVVEVDGERVTLTPHDGKPITIEAHPGKHGVVVKRDDVVLMGEDVSLEAGKEIKLTVRLEPVAGSGSTPAAAEVTSQPAGAGSTALLDRSRFDVLAGQWQVENNELVQKDLTRWYNSILFGDDQWTDYDFSVDAMRIGGGNSFSLVFRAGNRSDFYKYVIGGEGNTRSSVVADEGGQTRSLKILDFRFGIQDNRWYTARVHVRSNHIACFLYDAGSGKDTRLFDVHDDRFPRGRVGLETFISGFRFKDIKVTSPDGKVLWQGLPAVDSKTTAGPSPPASRESNTRLGARTGVAGFTGPSPPASREPNGWISLFNGKDRSGWKTHRSQRGNWRVKNGILIGSGPANSHLYTDRGDYGNFHLRLETRLNEGGNSGVYFRAPFGPTFPANNPQWLAAYNAKIDKNRLGGLIVDGALGRPLFRNQIPLFQPGQWITLEVIVQGTRVEIKIDGAKTADYTDPARYYSRGHIVLQQHGRQTVAEFRKIEIKELE